MLFITSNPQVRGILLEATKIRRERSEDEGQEGEGRKENFKKRGEESEHESESLCCSEEDFFTVAKELVSGKDGDAVPFHVVKRACRLVRESRAVWRRGGEKKHREEEREGVKDSGGIKGEERKVGERRDGECGMNEEEQEKEEDRRRLEEREVGRIGEQETGPWLQEVLRGSSLCFASPPQRTRSPELEARLAELRDGWERKQYSDLVKDITAKERAEGEREYMSSYKDQLGFGMHVVALMFTGFLVGRAAMSALFRNTPSLQLVGGIVGLVMALMVEICLFIIRSSQIEEAASRKTKDEERNRKMSSASRGSHDSFSSTPSAEEFIFTKKSRVDNDSRELRRRK